MNPQSLLPLGSRAAALLPRALAQGLASLAGDLAGRVPAPARRQATQNLRIALGQEPAAATLHGVFRTYARYYLDLMRLSQQSLSRAVGTVTLQGDDLLDDSLARGRGALVLSAHVGNWDVCAAALAQRFGGMCVFVEPLRPASLLQFYTRTRRRHAVEVCVAGSASRRPSLMLDANGVVGLVADRSFGARHAVVAFGNGRLAVPTAAIRLALRKRAAVHTVFALQEGARYTVRIEAPFGAPARARPEEAERDVATEYANRLLRTVRSHPDQWCLFHPLADREDTIPALVAGERGAA